MVAAAWRETDADRGEPVGDSARGAEAASPLEAMSVRRAAATCDAPRETRDNVRVAAEGLNDGPGTASGYHWRVVGGVTLA